MKYVIVRRFSVDVLGDVGVKYGLYFMFKNCVFDNILVEVFILSVCIFLWMI